MDMHEKPHQLRTENRFSQEEVAEKLLPTYEKIHPWELWSKDLPVEYRQCMDEGKDVAEYEALFSAIGPLPATEEKEKMSDALYSLVTKAKQRPDYPYCEPNEWDAILAQQEPYTVPLKCRDLDDQLLGAWYGRICGCFLGKPVEVIRSDELKTICRMTGNDPLHRYIDREDITEEVKNAVKFPIMARTYSKDLGYMPFDDDTNYMLIALEVLKRYGRNFTSENVGQVWLDSQPKVAYCTAERVAYKNLVNGFLPPHTASYKNAFREWIGAQIRADVLGYVNPCKPLDAAEMAWRDARLSHVKNGIYGEMWVAAMIAAAFGTEDVMEILRVGLSVIPKKSRLHEAVEGICREYENGISEDDCFRGIKKRWNEENSYDWCHTISNAEICTAAILYGGKDYGKTICLAVSQGFDTDCNGATVGSILGTLLGYRQLPKAWTDRVGDTLESSLVGCSRVSIRKMAEETKKYL